MRVSQHKQEMEVTGKSNPWGSATKCHLCCPVTAPQEHQGLQDQTLLCPGQLCTSAKSHSRHCPSPQHGVRGASPQTGLTKHSPSLISMSWHHSSPGLRCCPAQRDLAEPGDTPGQNLHSSWGPFTSNTAGSRKRKIWIKP